ncbi:OmpH family outer membrane protein [Neolewinella antarctica]|uniref:Skp family chaperone for outer membrane proteins n=1 Tax=Neolewinella antarctica TaxID=442734 RepID=A0ABX0XB65_9BACT|nr:OmpH family outer membrane protein [Neolewinella antarctica]NJC26173.1 Skp family chaperone for outer membrane proteins [Neolewinella antarctica]
MTNAASITLSGLLVSASLLFVSCQPQENAAVDSTASVQTTVGLNIVYIRVDSLETGYTELATELTRLQTNATAAQDNIQQKIAMLQKEVSSLQNKMQQGLMTPNKIQTEQQRIGRKEQEIMQQRDLALGSIQDDQLRLQEAFGVKVKDILTALQEEKGYDFIFNEGGGSGLLMASSAHDVTDLVLERLNALSADSTVVEEAGE